jgi:3-deoxy-D-manno-octulosonic-acid transferase
MLIQTRKVGLPILLFATTLGLSNRRMRWWARPWINLILNPITQISCVSEEDRANFGKLGLIEKIKVDGDTRYDEVIHRQEKQNPLPDIFLSPMNEPIFLAGSTWSEDEAVLMPLIQQSLKANNNVRFILCPHEPSLHHLQQLRGRLDAHRINWQFLSQVSTPWHKDTVIIVDQVGILADLYKLADIAFIGGSFARRVHSVMEALASGCWTWFGPRHKTNREAIEFTNLQFENRFPLALTIHSTKEAQQAMDRWLGFDAKEKFREELKKQVLLRSGASKRIARWLEPYVGTKI